MRIVIATGNPGKFEELSAMLEVDSISYTHIDVDVEETGQTYIENAILKAKAAAKLTGLPAIGDDSGLEILALGGYPGIKSARCAGDSASDAEKRDHILAAMDEITDRRAMFICSLAFVNPLYISMPTVFTGIVEGSIIAEPVGEAAKGLQYDSIFYYPPFGETFANVKGWRKNRVSHRAHACFQMAHYLDGMQRGHNKGFGNL